jgi:hypothetical protein
LIQQKASAAIAIAGTRPRLKHATLKQGADGSIKIERLGPKNIATDDGGDSDGKS